MFKRIIKNRLFVAFLSEYKWYRKLHGGHWEKWHIDHPVCSCIWLDVNQCSVGTNYREPGWRGTPLCENH